MQNILFVGWNAPKIGRESQAGELFTSVSNFFSRHLKGGKITSFDPVILVSHGGDLNGFFLVKGEPQHLEVIRNSEEFIKLSMQCGYALHGFGVLTGYTGDNLQKLMGDWMKMVK